MQQRQRLTCYCFTFLLLATSVCGQLSPQASRLAENLGMLLGLPLDVDLPNTNSSAAPDFLVDVYNCWTALKGSKNRASCLPVHDAEDKDSLEDVNVVRSIQGAAMQTTSDGSFSHSPDMPLPESIAFKFNVSLRQMKEDIRYVYVRVPKNTLTAIERDHVKNQCPENSPITLKLLVKINTTEDSHGVYTLLSKAELRRSEIGEKRQIEFSGIREQFKDWLENQIAAPKPHDFTELRLIIGEGCYDRLTPKQLGFSTNSSAYIVMFSKSDDSDEIIIKAGLAELAAELTASRHTRSVGDGGNHIDEDLAGERINGSNTTLDSDSIAFNISRYHLYSCRRYSHTISFAELGWSRSILRPLDYEANFCAGSCHFPLTGNYNTTKHSYIQSLAAKLNPTLVPPPCCAPHKLLPVTVIFQQQEETFVTEDLPGMKAESCGCK